MPQRPDYGVDGPLAITIMLILGGTLLAATAVPFGLGVPPPLAISVRVLGALIGANLLGIAGGMLWYSRIGKLRLRQRLSDLIPWRGDEAVLDIGCGRGLLLNAAARSLTTGTATGVDVWRNDVSGNRPEAALENAEREGVADRVAVKDGDARGLPFPDACFDVVVSGLVLHNIRDRAGRRQALCEIVRVLKPGGRVVLLDLRHTAEYVEILRECGLSDTQRSAVWRRFSPGFRLVTWGAVHYCWISSRQA